MENLKELSIADEGEKLKLCDHSFRGCSSLTKVYLPDRVTNVGISSFRDDVSLKELSVNESLKDEPGIAELKEILPDLKVIYR